MDRRGGTALLLIAHGSRRPEANRDLDWLADQFRSGSEYAHVQTAYLELTEPTIRQGGTICAERGAGRVLMVPFFLSPGVHVREDLTEARDELNEAFPAVDFRLTQPLGRHALLVEILKERIAEAS